MKHWEKFKTYKQRGEWVELLFMAAAAAHGYHVLKPWGDTLSDNVGVEIGAHFLRVQVKSTSHRRRSGYYCRFRGGPRDGGYDLKDVAFFAYYVVPRNIWYLIPAAVILTPSPTMAIVVCPDVLPSWDCYRYERYREAWGLLGKDRRELFRRGKH